MDNVFGMINWNRIIVVSKNDRVRILADHHRLRAYTANELRLLAKFVVLVKLRFMEILRDFYQEM